MGLVNYGVPRSLVMAAKQRFGVRAFVETGTFRGDTAAFAAEQFEKVYTVEFVMERYLETKKRLSVFPNVHCLQGNSPDVLSQISGELKGIPTLFWLDAHWNGDGASREFECPVAGEVKAINDANLDAYILVDDARYFLAPPGVPCNPDAWPSLPELTALLAHGDRYVVMVDDAIVAWPKHTQPYLIEYTRSRPSAWTAAASNASGAVYYIPRSEVASFTVS